MFKFDFLLETRLHSWLFFARIAEVTVCRECNTLASWFVMPVATDKKLQPVHFRIRKCFVPVVMHVLSI